MALIYKPEIIENFNGPQDYARPSLCFVAVQSGRVLPGRYNAAATMALATI